MSEMKFRLIRFELHLSGLCFNEKLIAFVLKFYFKEPAAIFPGFESWTFSVESYHKSIII